MLVGAFSVIVKTDCETDGALHSSTYDAGRREVIPGKDCGSTDHGWVGDSVVDHGVHGDGDGVPGEHLLGRHVEADGAEVHLLVGVDTGDDEEDARSLAQALFKVIFILFSCISNLKRLHYNTEIKMCV